MNILKAQIINYLSMENVLNKYGIKVNHNRMYKCPFHKDDSPSAKCYDKSFYCFSCHRTGDMINFVQFLYNLNFQEGLDKINDDFQLGLKTRGNYNKSKILEIEKQNQLKLIREEKRKDYFRRLCARKDLYNNLAEKVQKKQITNDNWEDTVLLWSYYDTRANLLEAYICEEYDIEY